jgi:predicted nucleotidyltransferase
MGRDDVIARIRESADAIRALGARSLYLYGSYARDEAHSDSDVDVFVERDPAKHFGFIELTELEFLLSDIVRGRVDLSTRTGLHPAIRKEIEKTAIRVL